MADDIVTRLREEFITDGHCNYCDQWEWRGHYPACPYQSAANEIERLREQLALWKKTAKHIRYHHCKPIGCKYCAMYAEEYPNDPVVD